MKAQQKALENKQALTNYFKVSDQFPITQWTQTPLHTSSSTPVESLWSLECHCTGRNSTLPIALPLDSSSWWSNNIWRLTLRKSFTASMKIRKEWKRLYICEKRFLICVGSRTIHLPIFCKFSYNLICLPVTALRFSITSCFVPFIWQEKIQPFATNTHHLTGKFAIKLLNSYRSIIVSFI